MEVAQENERLRKQLQDLTSTPPSEEAGEVARLNAELEAKKQRISQLKEMIGDLNRRLNSQRSESLPKS